ncbi:MAG: UDP-N-acetylmuramoyl-L-alanyl-D-glutamate--2,6-diaminopimelate ligase [Bacillota bacterium]
MQLKKLISCIEPDFVRGPQDVEVNKLVHDSRKAEENSLFICITGFETDGHLYISEAVKNGAQVIVIEKELDSYRNDLTYIKVNDSRKAMSFLAACFYDYPLQDIKLIGVTGTNGKTTTTYLLKSIIEAAGYKCGLIGTINILLGDKTISSERTTPESLEIYHYLDQMRTSGVDYVVMEVSSHALKLKRVAGMEFAAAIFTNLSRDHLDFHDTFADYAETKARLFRQLSEQGQGIINQDDQYAELMKKATQGQYLTFALQQDADFRATDISLNPASSSFRVQGKMTAEIDLNISGQFNIYNALGTVACGWSLGLSQSAIQKGLKELPGIPGRFEHIGGDQDFTVVVDYAHTPDGMENVLSTARQLVTGKLRVVFGCGGDRDRKKRPLMGKIGVKYGDYSYITSDNPRTEEPGEIIDQIIKGVTEYEKEIAREQKVSYEVIPNRREAIFQAIKEANRGDMVLIIGKGHETYQIFKDRTIDFDDREVAREAVEQFRGGENNCRP